MPAPVSGARSSAERELSAARHSSSSSASGGSVALHSFFFFFYERKESDSLSVKSALMSGEPDRRGGHVGDLMMPGVSQPALLRI